MDRKDSLAEILLKFHNGLWVTGKTDKITSAIFLQIFASIS